MIGGAANSVAYKYARSWGYPGHSRLGDIVPRKFVWPVGVGVRVLRVPTVQLLSNDDLIPPFQPEDPNDYTSSSLGVSVERRML